MRTFTLSHQDVSDLYADLSGISITSSRSTDKLRRALYNLLPGMGLRITLEDITDEEVNEDDG